jgi:hypothetical protein
VLACLFVESVGVNHPKPRGGGSDRARMFYRPGSLGLTLLPPYLAGLVRPTFIAPGTLGIVFISRPAWRYLNLVRPAAVAPGT